MIQRSISFSYLASIELRSVKGRANIGLWRQGVEQIGHLLLKVHVRDVRSLSKQLSQKRTWQILA